MTAADRFAMVRRDQLWVRGTLDESRSSQGQAIIRSSEIVARDTIDDRGLQRTLTRTCEREMARLRRAIEPIRDARVRGMVTASVATGFSRSGRLKPAPTLESTITITVEGISIVSGPDHARSDYDALRVVAGSQSALPDKSRPQHLPIVWRNGSAAVLLHEAIGHAAEHRHAPLAWPRWLRVRDETANGRTADLIAGELPLALRRESFRDVPLRRMTRLIVEQSGAPFELPAERIEVHLVAGGAYEPLTEMISVDVAVADLVSPRATQRIGVFTVRGSRSAISRALLGATGDPIRYPGVICSREGQELFVGSHAPVIVTTELE